MRLSGDRNKFKGYAFIGQIALFIRQNTEMPRVQILSWDGLKKIIPPLHEKIPDDDGFVTPHPNHWLRMTPAYALPNSLINDGKSRSKQIVDAISL